MPRFKPVDHGLQFLAVDLSEQLHPGRFEYALHRLIEHEIDLSEIEARDKSEYEGAAAYDPRVLLKIVLLAYSRGIISSRSMEAACCTDVLFMALSGNSAPHFSTLANFVSRLGEAIGKILTDNESAKMPTDKGVVQGYTGVAAVDEKNQIIVQAQAHGTGSQPRTAAAGYRSDPTHR